MDHHPPPQVSPPPASTATAASTARRPARFFGLRLAPRDHQALGLARASRLLREQAERVSRWPYASDDGAPLARRAVYQLVAAVLLLDGELPATYQQAREQLLASGALRPLFADVVDDLAWLDELGTRCGPLSEEQSARGRYLVLLGRLPRVERRVELYLRARQQANGAHPLARRVLGAAAVLVAAAGAFGVPYVLASPRPPVTMVEAGAEPARVTPGPAEPPEVRDDPERCFEATYFATPDFVKPVATRRDCAIAFDWGMAGVPDVAGLPADHFSVRWRGALRAPATDTYVFFLASDDGSRLFLDGQPIIDNWGSHGLQERPSAPMALRAGEAHALQVDYYDAGYTAAVQLSWRSSTMDKRPLSGRYVGRPTAQPNQP